MGKTIMSVDDGTIAHGGAGRTIAVQTKNGYIYPDTGTVPWMRYLLIELINNNGDKISIGGYDGSLAIEVNVTKVLASAGNTASVVIYNMPIATTIKILNGGYTANVKIYCGYYNTNKILIFNGGVAYTEESRSNNNTTYLKLDCCCKLISDRFQKVMPLSFNAGINMYKLIEEVGSAYGVSGQIEIDESLKEDIVNIPLSRATTLQGWIDLILNSSSSNRSYGVNTDSNESSLVSLLGYKKIGSGNTFVIRTMDLNLQSYPTLSSDGLKLVLSPIYAMTPGDIVSIDNAASSLIGVSGGVGNIGNQIYLDKDGLYNIREMNYTLNNRGDDFKVEVLAISRTNVLKIMMGDNE